MATHDGPMVPRAQQQPTRGRASSVMPADLYTVAAMGTVPAQNGVPPVVIRLSSAIRNSVFLAAPNAVDFSMSMATGVGVPQAALDGASAGNGVQRLVAVTASNGFVPTVRNRVLPAAFSISAATGDGVSPAAVNGAGAGYPDPFVVNVGGRVLHEVPYGMGFVDLSNLSAVTGADGTAAASYQSTGMAPAAINGVRYPNAVLVSGASLGGRLSHAVPNGVGLSCPDEVIRVITNLVEGSSDHIIHVPEVVAGATFQHLHAAWSPAAAAEQLGGWFSYNSGRALPIVAPAAADGNNNHVAARAFPERLRRGLPGLGYALAVVAVIGLTRGEPTTAVGIGLMVMLVVGFALIAIGVLFA